MAKKSKSRKTYKRIPKSAKIQFGGWTFDLSQAFEETINDAIALIISEAAREEELIASLPRMWTREDGQGGPAVKDPLTVYVVLPIGDDEDRSPRWKFTLDQLVEDALELHENVDQKTGELFADQAGIDALLEIKNGLIALAEKMDKRISRIKADD